MEAKIKDQAKCNLKKGNTALLLMMVQKSGGYQLRLVVYPIIYDGFDTSQVVVWDFWTINSRFYYLLAGETGVSMGSTNRFNLNPQLVVKKHIAWMSGKNRERHGCSFAESFEEHTVGKERYHRKLTARPAKWCLEDKPFLLGPGDFLGATSGLS